MINHNPHIIKLGINQTNTPFQWNTHTTPHLGIFGSTGGGKGGTLRPIIVHAIAHGQDITVLSGKPTGEFGWFVDMGGEVHTPEIDVSPDAVSATNIDGMVAAVDDCFVEMIRRAEICQRESYEHWSECLAVKPGESPTRFLIIDEFASFVSRLADRTGDKAIDKELQARQGRVIRRVQDITAMARSTDIHVVIMTQKPDVGAVGGGAVLNNLGGRVVTNASGKAIEQALGESPSGRLVKTPGRVWHVGVLGEVPEQAQVGWIPVGDVGLLIDGFRNRRRC